MNSVLNDIINHAVEAEVIMRDPDCGVADTEPHSIAIYEIASKHPELREEIFSTIKSALIERFDCSYEVFLLTIHLLNWPELRRWVHDQRNLYILNHDWRGEPVFRHLCEACEMDWDEKDCYMYFKNERTRS